MSANEEASSIEPASSVSAVGRLTMSLLCVIRNVADFPSGQQTNRRRWTTLESEQVATNPTTSSQGLSR
jgi:hypothetical protein